MNASGREYRGRIAPTPTGFLHLGHARTFWTAQRRARQADGALVLRIDDLDFQRCGPDFTDAAIEDTRWFGLRWDEGPDIGGDFAPYRQSARGRLYGEAFQRLLDGGHLYPCTCSRKDIREALHAPHSEGDEVVYPGTCRHRKDPPEDDARVTWRFRVTDGETVRFTDQLHGPVAHVAGQDFGDFPVWRKDGLPSYHLSCVVDDAAMGITEVVRGDDLLLSTSRQILLYRALGMDIPGFFHCPLMTDASGRRLAKRDGARSLRELRDDGHSPESLRQHWLTD